MHHLPKRLYGLFCPDKINPERLHRDRVKPLQPDQYIGKVSLRRLRGNRVVEFASGSRRVNMACSMELERRW